MVITTEAQLKQKQKTYKYALFASVVVFMCFAFWQGYSALQVHQRYQQSLMQSVIARISSEYQLLVAANKSVLNEFQQTHRETLSKLYEEGPLARQAEYMEVLRALKEKNENIRLFSIISPARSGVFQHITGDFLPDCKEEIRSTFDNTEQEELFLHRSSKSIHYDLLLPLFDHPGAYFFVAFNVDPIQEMLTKFSLPHQELFLLRNDNIGKIELSSTNEISDNIAGLVMTTDEIEQFSFIEPIENTRWNLAIRLSESYRTQIIKASVTRAVLMTVFFCLILLFVYRLIRRSTSQLIQVRDYLYQQQKYDPLTGAFTQNAFVNQVTRFLSTSNRTDKFLVSFKFAKDVNTSDKDLHEEYYVKHFSSALMTFLGDEYTYGRVNDIILVISSKLGTKRLNHLAEASLKYVEDFNMRYNDNLNIQMVAIPLNEKFSAGLELVRAVCGIQANRQPTPLTVVDADSEEVKQVFEDQYLVQSLSEAIANETLLLYRQAISEVGHEGNSVEQYEVLCRLELDGEIVSPMKFIPLAEQSDLIVSLDKYMFRKSLEKLTESSLQTTLSINLSGKTLTHPNLKTFIEDGFKQYDIAPARITFEVTETYAVTHIDEAKAFISWARALGCQFALDDFGQGVSSFSYLQSLPISKLKIDGCFIKDIHKNTKNRMIVSTMVNLCHQFKLASVAEFVEDEEILTVLRDIGVDYAQGYGIHKPERW
ncbi:hypothetical protein KUL49_16460 [Alteromonas sp. KUL49]|nr:EAL domain-containing protein [Alteromonas sp. KUL49]GEA11271.1 hypothetical protein KUL49_16460 [Alteromonas sp. KUL49]